VVHNVPDITGTGAAVPLIPGGVRTSAAWVQIVTGSANTANVRFGDSTTSATSGTRLPANSSQLLPPLANAECYDLAQLYVFMAAGDTISCVYAKT
jgi:hypothetical protein